MKYTLEDFMDEVIKEVERDNLPNTAEGINEAMQTVVGDKIVSLTNRIIELEKRNAENN